MQSCLLSSSFLVQPCQIFSVITLSVMSTDPKQPTVRILKPPDSDLSGSQNIIHCVITGFFPSEISVHWQLNKVQLDASRFTNSPVVANSEAEGYSIYSALILPASQWKEEIYSCVVSHESSQNPIIATLENLYGGCHC